MVEIFIPIYRWVNWGSKCWFICLKRQSLLWMEPALSPGEPHRRVPTRAFKKGFTVQTWFSFGCIFKVPQAFCMLISQACMARRHLSSKMALQAPSLSGEDQTCWRIAYHLILLTLTPNHLSLNRLFSKGDWRKVTSYPTTSKTNSQRGWQPFWSNRCGINLYIHPTKWEDTGKWDVTGEIKKKMILTQSSDRKQKMPEESITVLGRHLEMLE